MLKYNIRRSSQGAKRRRTTLEQLDVKELFASFNDVEEDMPTSMKSNDELVHYSIDFDECDSNSSSSSDSDEVTDEAAFDDHTYATCEYVESLNEYFASIANQHIQPIQFKNAKLYAVLLALAQAKQKYNMSNNTISFVLRSLRYVAGHDIDLPMEWNALVRQLNMPTPSKFQGCAHCGRYIFEKDDKVCKVCKYEKEVRIVYYVSVMQWIKFLFANSQDFVSRLITEVEDEGMYSILVLFICCINKKIDEIVDWYNGDYCKKILNESNNDIIGITICCDGLALYKTRQSNLWPLIFNVANSAKAFRKDLQNLLPLSVMEVRDGNWSDLLQLLFFKEMQYLHNNST